ncbi:MAG: hypothetical protein AABZ06_03430 [Bdellovibrionota bacterium]
MKSWFYVFGLMFVSLSLPMQTFADHGDGTVGNGSGARLNAEAQQLDSHVRWTNMSWSVKDAVSRFVLNANSLANCESRRLAPMDHSWPTPPRDCSFEVNRVLNSFALVEHYLYDAEYQYPLVYRSYIRTARIINEIKSGVVNPPYPPNPPMPPEPPVCIEATGSLDGLSFNFIGNDRYSIQQQCQEFGYRNRITYVFVGRVNGQRFGRGYGECMTLGEACGVVARHAR